MQGRYFKILLDNFTTQMKNIQYKLDNFQHKFDVIQFKWKRSKVATFDSQ